MNSQEVLLACNTSDQVLVCIAISGLSNDGTCIFWAIGVLNLDWNICREIEPDDITMVDRLALVSVVGRNMSRRSGTSGKIFGALGNAGVNIRMITQSSEEISIIVGVDNADFDRTIGVIYNGFVRDEMVSR